MKAALPLHCGASVTVEALAGQVILQLVQHGLRPQTVALDTEQCAKLIDVLGLVGVLAEDQAYELDLAVALCELQARQQAPRELHQAEPSELEVPAFLREQGGGHA